MTETNTEVGQSALPTIELDAKQLEAVEACCNLSNRIVAVTGDPGTGKTTIMRLVYQTMVDAGYTVVLCAPTGKAARRIREATGLKAQTIHQLLEYTHPGEPDPKTGKPVRETYPKRDATNRLEYDIVLCDEYSMVNKELHSNLFHAMKFGGAVRVFGDVNQLQPIEQDERLRLQPSPFMNLLSKFTSVRLDKNHRQAEGSGVAANCARIVEGKIPQRNDEFQLVFTDKPDSRLMELVLEALEDGVDYSTLQNQIISPAVKSWVGTAKLNPLLQRLFVDGNVTWHVMPRHAWDKTPLRIRVGEKIVFTSNNYDLRQESDRWETKLHSWPEDYEPTPDEDPLGYTTRSYIPPRDIDQIFNGETGIVQDVDDFGVVAVDMGDRVVHIPPEIETTNREGNVVTFDPRKDIQLAYVITTHKAQGSEYQHLIYVLNKSTRYNQNRRNLYTGVSRARRTVQLLTDQVSLTHSISKKE